MKTIKDVAKKAGVGIATVSRFLNKKGYVSEESAEKINAAMEELDYVPNAAARSIKSQKSNTIALFIPSISNAFFPELASAIENKLIQYGYKLIICNVNEDQEREKKYIDMILENRIDGVISSTGYISQRLYDSNVPIVSMDRFHENPDRPVVTVMSDHSNGAINATKHLIKKGCKNLLHLHGDIEEVLPAKLRYDAFVKTCEAKKVSYHCFSVDDELTPEFVKKFDGAFVWTDIDAIKFISFCLENGIQIPNEMKVVGYDDISLASIIYPKLTTISQPTVKLGETACEILMKMIEKKNYKSKNVIFDTVLEERDTTKGEK